jgi:HSP20 family molecular chaperone IbpA
MSSQDWELLIWQRANALLRQAERIQRNFVQIAVSSQYRVSQGRSSSWEPPINVVESDGVLWVIVAIPGVRQDRVQVGLRDNYLIVSGDRPLPDCCTEGELKIWEVPLGRFERHIGPIGAGYSLAVEKTSLQDGLLVIQLRKNL